MRSNISRVKSTFANSWNFLVLAKGCIYFLHFLRAVANWFRNTKLLSTQVSLWSVFAVSHFAVSHFEAIHFPWNRGACTPPPPRPGSCNINAGLTRTEIRIRVTTHRIRTRRKTGVRITANRKTKSDLREKTGSGSELNIWIRIRNPVFENWKFVEF